MNEFLNPSIKPIYPQTEMGSSLAKDEEKRGSKCLERSDSSKRHLLDIHSCVHELDPVRDLVQSTE